MLLANLQLMNAQHDAFLAREGMTRTWNITGRRTRSHRESQHHVEEVYRSNDSGQFPETVKAWVDTFR